MGSFLKIFTNNVKTTTSADWIEQCVQKTSTNIRKTIANKECGLYKKIYSDQYGKTLNKSCDSTSTAKAVQERNRAKKSVCKGRSPQINLKRNVAFVDEKECMENTNTPGKIQEVINNKCIEYIKMHSNLKSKIPEQARIDYDVDGRCGSNRKKKDLRVLKKEICTSFLKIFTNNVKTTTSVDWIEQCVTSTNIEGMINEKIREREEANEECEDYKEIYKHQFNKTLVKQCNSQFNVEAKKQGYSAKFWVCKGRSPERNLRNNVAFVDEKECMKNTNTPYKIQEVINNKCKGYIDMHNFFKNKINNNKRIYKEKYGSYTVKSWLETEYKEDRDCVKHLRNLKQSICLKLLKILGVNSFNTAKECVEASTSTIKNKIGMSNR